VKRWFFSSFLVSLLSLGLAGANASSLAASWIACADNKSSSGKPEEQLARSAHARRAFTRRTITTAAIDHPPIPLEPGFPCVSHGSIRYPEIGPPDKVPIPRV
jgi:hypothetical protein